jgi:hypothetical protein
MRQSELSLVETPPPAVAPGHSTGPVPRRISVLVIDDDDLYREKFRSADPVFGCIQNYASFGYRWLT